jgi:hypothetical protein
MGEPKQSDHRRQKALRQRSDPRSVLGIPVSMRFNHLDLPTSLQIAVSDAGWPLVFHKYLVCALICRRGEE